MMSDHDYSRMHDILGKHYNARVEVQIDHRSTFGMHECVDIHVSIDFGVPTGFELFINDLFLLDKLKEERNIRTANPTVQRAYDEYQTLLKLSK